MPQPDSKKVLVSNLICAIQEVIDVVPDGEEAPGQGICSTRGKGGHKLSGSRGGNMPVGVEDRWS